MAIYTSEELSGNGVLFGDTLNAGETGTFNFNIVGSDAIESLSGSAYFTMERQTNGSNEYAVDVKPLSGRFSNSTPGQSMGDLGFVENTYRWSINVGNTLNSPRITFIPDIDVNDSPVILRATGGINVNVTIAP